MNMKQFNQRMLKDGGVTADEITPLEFKLHLPREKMRSLVAVLQISCDRGMK
jgi:hypothetical protein